VHTSSEAAEFIHELLMGVESKICQVAAVRMDAGFPEEDLLLLCTKLSRFPAVELT
jgi:hypothetical protein